MEEYPQSVKDMMRKKEYLIMEATAGIELSKAEKSMFGWLFTMDIYTVSNICNVLNKARCINAKTK